MLSSTNQYQKLFTGRYVTRAAWEGRREPESQSISWRKPIVLLKRQRPVELSAQACVQGVVLAHF